MEEMQKGEVERSVKLQQEERIAKQVFQSLRDNPNAELNEIQTEVTLLNRKVEPLLQRVEQAAKNVIYAKDSGFSKVRGSLGMLSKMGGRLISFYADELASMMLEDFLKDTAVDLQKIEQKQGNVYKGQEAKFLAENLLSNIIDYQNEENLVGMRWNNPGFQKQVKQIGLDGLQKNPDPIQFNMDEELVENNNVFSKGEQNNGSPS